MRSENVKNWIVYLLGVTALVLSLQCQQKTAPAWAKTNDATVQPKSAAVPDLPAAMAAVNDLGAVGAAWKATAEEWQRIAMKEQKNTADAIAVMEKWERAAKNWQRLAEDCAATQPATAHIVPALFLGNPQGTAINLAADDPPPKCVERPGFVCASAPVWAEPRNVRMITREEEGTPPAEPGRRYGYAVPVMVRIGVPDPAMCAEVHKRQAANERGEKPQGPPITNSPCGFRINLMFNTLPIDQKAWDVLATSNGTKDGTFPVRLWRIRGSRAERMQVYRIPSRPTDMRQEQLSAEQFKVGDLAVIEDALGLFPEAMQASVIDNASGDPIRVPLTRMAFREGGVQ